MKKSPRLPEEEIAYVFQGGGALGAYQVGIVQGLAESGYEPDWLVGTSIGAINASILAGNPPETRSKQLEKFWHTILWTLPDDDFFAGTSNFKNWQHQLSAQMAIWFGVPGFFSPNLFNPIYPTSNSPTEISFYNVLPLRKTLTSLIDFDYLNAGHTRLSLGAVNIQTSTMRYFDSRKETIRLEHILASTALPPAFPLVEIEGHYYWDGGLCSNTPLAYLLKTKENVDTLCFMVQLFSVNEDLPVTLDQIEKRKKEIAFASKHRDHIQRYQQIQNLRRALSTLSEILPDKLKNDKKIAELLALGDHHTLEVVNFSAPNFSDQLSSKDYEFSFNSANQLMSTGYQDAQLAVKLSPWRQPMGDATGVRLHDVGGETVSLVKN